MAERAATSDRPSVDGNFFVGVLWALIITVAIGGLVWLGFR
jgi:hypothetical protein